MDRTEIHAELDRVLFEFDELVTRGSAADLRRRSAGTRWTNRQVLFHMVFGYLIVRTLLPLVHALGRLGWSRRLAAALNAARRPFHLINYLTATVVTPVGQALCILVGQHAALGFHDLP